LDVKPDIHVMRVFARSGLIEKSAKENDAIEMAKKLHPKFPGALDAPAFIIGVEWCRPTKKKCEKCPISKACPSEYTQQG
jgi:endonuclease III